MAEKFVNIRIIKLTFEMHNVSGPGNPVACSSSSICDDYHHHNYDNRDDYDQRCANSILMTEYKYEYYLTFKKGERIRIQILFGLKKQPNTNTNIIRFEKGDQIRIRILFGLKKATEYKYEYYLV